MLPPHRLVFFGGACGSVENAALVTLLEAALALDSAAL